MRISSHDLIDKTTHLCIKVCNGFRAVECQNNVDGLKRKSVVLIWISEIRQLCPFSFYLRGKISDLSPAFHKRHLLQTV